MEPADESTLEALASAIFRQIDALGSLRFKFEVQQMMLAGGRAGWVEETTRELRTAIEEVQSTDLHFRRQLQAVGIALSLSPEATLREVAEAAEDPWRYIYSQGREELRTAIERVGMLCEENRKLLARGFLATTEALAMLGLGSLGMSYDASGAPLPPLTAAAIINMKA
jgi:hypothetical protein